MVTGAVRILIEIDTAPGVAGGIAQATQGLIRSLGELEGPEQFVLAARTAEQADWIRNYCGPNQQIVIKDREWNRQGTVRRVIQKVRSAVGRLTPPAQWPALPVSDGYYESLGCHVLHFPTQAFTLCALPTIYNPHDLQHVHYPQFFSPAELASREVTYRSACQLSRTVVVGSEWIKQDVVTQFGVSPSKVQVVPLAPPTVQYPALPAHHLDSARARLRLPERYTLYPAVTWPHKNHLRLFDALAYLRDTRGIVVNLVCTGAKYPSHWPTVEQHLRARRLEQQVSFLGFLPEVDLRAVYRLAEFLVLPTLFEADSCPIHEAWSEGIPVASSNLTALPEQVMDAGLLFDATDVTAIADAIQKMATDRDLRQRLVERGKCRVMDFDWARTAQAYRAVYRRTAGMSLNDEDRALLEWNWMKEPRTPQRMDQWQ